MTSIGEYQSAEEPLIRQLEALGWSHIEGDKWDPRVSERESFHEVVLEERLRPALRKINLDDDGKGWLDDERLSQSVSALTRLSGLNLIEANAAATELLLKGTTVPGVEGWDGGRDRTVRYIDWRNPERNDFLVVNQFRVDEPGGQARRFVVPDLVLFVNGIPLVVIECKGPEVHEPMAEAITQLRRYANQREEVEASEGSERLFWTNQFMVGTTFDHARVGTFTAAPEHFLEWKDTEPVAKDDVAAELGKSVDELAGQELLAAGMLRPAHLLDIIRHFTLFMEISGRTIKAVCRYQQFRGVWRAIDRLKSGKTRAEEGEVDRRGGVIWHTQGSGKSLTMVFLVRKMRSDPELRRFKVVIVTDRTDLQYQLSSTAELSGETVTVAKRSAQLREVLPQPGPALVFAMIQKYRDEDAAPSTTLTDDEGSQAGFTVLNDDESILVMVDEAHRSHSSTLHANLLNALPNCARIGFTGTPIIMGARKRTHEIFGDFIDRYTITESEADGSTVPILYEGRTARGAVKGASDLDAVFEDFFVERTPEEIEEIKRRYATTGNVLEASAMIEEKARDMLRHYVASVLPNRLKGMVVASSRVACVRYREAFISARDALVSELEGLDPSVAALAADELDALPKHEQFLARARPHVDIVRDLDFVPVISGTNNDDPSWDLWTDPIRQRIHINQFNLALGPSEERSDPTAILIVKSMLLTGFDAPVAQVLYLDRSIREAELLQAVARVNRTAEGKDCGLVVDYFGVADHLSDALSAYSADDLEGTMRRLTDEVPRLDSRHQRILQFFAQHGVDRLDTEGGVLEAVDILQDPRLRAEFDVMLKQFLTSLDTVLPRPEALPHGADAKRFGEIQFRVRRRYRDRDDGGFDASLYRGKVRQLIDEHIVVLDLAEKIAPVSLTDADFSSKVSGLASDRAKASEMEHALRFHIRRHFDEDPARYKRLSERLDEILDQLTDKWDQLAIALEGLVAEARSEPPDDGTGLEPRTEAPFYGVIVEALGHPPSDRDQAVLVDATKAAVEHIRGEIRRVGFWSNGPAQDELRRWLARHLDGTDRYDLDACAPVADRLIELARTNHHRLAGQ